MPQVLIFLLYRALLTAGLPVLLLYVARRCWRDPAYRRHWRERFGSLPPLPPTCPGGIWLHAVSVGEVLSAVPLLQQLRAAYPHRMLYVSCGTVAGRALAEQRLDGLADRVFAAPFDLVWVVRRVLRRLRPAALVVVETEIWPNLWREASRCGVELVVVNGRISDRAFPRYERLRTVLSAVLRLPRRILVQDQRARGRYLALGALPERVMVGGNLKFDFRCVDDAPAVVTSWLRHRQPDSVWIAASVMPPLADELDETEQVLHAFRGVARTVPGLLLVLVPRKPERFETTADQLARAGVPFVRRSALQQDTVLALPGVLLVDSVGELASLFPLADVVFMGGTLVRRGGHNVLEPAACRKAIIAGPSMENFPAVAEAMAGAMLTVKNAEELQNAVGQLLASPAERAALGEKARAVAESERGATGRGVAAVREAVSGAMPGSVPLLPWDVATGPLSLLWLIGARWNGKRRAARARSLPGPVISVGNLVLGGTGKTPLTAWLVKQLAEAGRHPAVLTRGYRRATQEAFTVLCRGETAAVSRTGDEAQTLLRLGLASLAIGGDRWQAGQAVRERCGADVFVLDDGYQHRQLRRDLNLVLLDALDPFGGKRLFPRGRLREPRQELSRADAFIITRCPPGDDPSGLRAELARWQPDAPVFTSHVRPVAWVNVRTGATLPLTALARRPALAFAGLANPATFWQSLREVDGDVRAWRTFADHHRYTGDELVRLCREAWAVQAELLLTTEKDSVNLPGLDHTEWPIYYLRVQAEVVNASALWALVRERLEPGR